MSTSTDQELEFRLTHDVNKVLKGGKRRYSDADSHLIYLTGDEVKELGEPDAVTLRIAPAA